MSAHLTDEQREAVALGAGEPHLDAHLAGCAECRGAVADAKGRRALLGGLTPYTLSDLAFRRVEARLMEQVDEGLPAPWPRWLTVALPLAAAAAVVAVVAPWRVPAVAPAPAPVARPAPRPFAAMVATLASADARRRGPDGAFTPVRAGDEVATGGALSATRLVLSSPALVLEAEGDWAAGGEAQVVLGAGAVAANGAAEVLAGARRVTGVEAVFRVARTAAEVVVDVARGDVVVLDDVTAQRRAVTGPARLRWADGSPLSQGVSEALVAFGEPVAPRGPVVPLDLSGLPAGTLVSVDGQGFGEAPVSLAFGPGRHRVALTPPGQVRQERFIDLVGGVPFTLGLGPAQADRESDGPEPDARALARVLDDLRRQTPRLRACYEKWLKATPTAAGQVDLVLVVTAKGVVKRADVRGDAIPPSSAACLKTTAKAFVLSPLGSEQELEVPLVLTNGRP
ncbi:MAG: hypothetical protein INH41_26220 [Myxococcaceae bacterium]|jgi:hypothetical protein|nr:hypothetical protein [Myxococcaceae bacterium]MCA3015898.1 hypothetical protein [Myxococcaceae bacterium]